MSPERMIAFAIGVLVLLVVIVVLINVLDGAA